MQKLLNNTVFCLKMKQVRISNYRKQCIKLAGALWYQGFGFRAMCILARQVLPLSYKPRKSRSSSLNCFVLFHTSYITFDAVANGH